MAGQSQGFFRGVSGALRRGYARLACVEAIEGQHGRGNLAGVWQGQSEENSVWKLLRGVSGVQPGEGVCGNYSDT